MSKAAVVVAVGPGGCISAVLRGFSAIVVGCRYLFRGRQRFHGCDAGCSFDGADAPGQPDRRDGGDQVRWGEVKPWVLGLWWGGFKGFGNKPVSEPSNR